MFLFGSRGYVYKFLLGNWLGDKLCANLATSCSRGGEIMCFLLHPKSPDSGTLRFPDPPNE
jgi:hypothetical protein